MQIALIIEYGNSVTIRELNRYLQDGFKVISTCPMPSSTTANRDIYPPTCLVIISNDPK